MMSAPSQPATDPMARVPVTVVAGGQAGIDLVARRLMAAAESGAVLVTPGFAECATWEEIANEEEVVAASPDCVCCALRADLVRVVSTLVTRRFRPARIVIATTPDADIALVVNSFLRSGTLNRHSYIDAVVSIDHGDPGDASESARGRWLLADGDASDPGSIFGLGSWDLRTVTQRLGRSGRCARADTTLEVDGVLDGDHLMDFLELVQDEHGPQVYRVEGDVRVSGEECRWLVQGVRRTLEIDDGRPSSVPDPSRLRITGWDLPTDDLAHAFARAAV
ncbi:MAG: GTP-binding protein [Acidimicrobiia bacterium]